MKLSVIVPVYHTEDSLATCLDSILRTPWLDIEIIVVDDGSEGNVKDILRDYPEKVVRLITHEKNRGLYQARITGISHATGDYVGFVDSDDYVSPDFFLSMMLRAEESNAEIIANTTIRRRDSGECEQLTFHKICFPEALKGEAVRKVFFDQAGACYAWHTIWNKIYAKTLWDRSLPYLKQLNRHLNMTEDIAFSSILFFNAYSFESIDAGCYYYCINEKQATNSNRISYDKFKKNLEDIVAVFDFVSRYLDLNGASAEVLEGQKKFRKLYALSWNGLRRYRFANGSNDKESKAFVDRLFPIDETCSETPDSFYFEHQVSQLNNELAAIKDQIIDNDTKLVSFDIFDTLLLRNLWKPEDVFIVMQKRINELLPRLRGIKFIDIRRAAEDAARREAWEHNREDTTLDKIYEKIGQILWLSSEETEQLKSLEIETELRFIRPRKTGKALLELAVQFKKTVVLTSDIYLPKKVICQLLEKCGYPMLPMFLSSEIGLLKSTGSLFQYVVKETKIRPTGILHIGDTWETDCLQAERSGLKFAFLPKARDVFCNRYAPNRTNRLAWIGDSTSGGLLSGRQAIDSLSYRSMLALVSNRFFDNPFTSWNQSSDFDGNPEIIGYYPLGMHVVAVATWIAELVRKKGTRSLVFLGRDGYLPIRVFKKLKNFLGCESVETIYVPCSRRAMLPILVKTREDLYNLPVNFREHTPITMLDLLSFCHGVAPAEYESFLLRAGFGEKANFKSIEIFTAFVKWFAENCFSEEVLENNKEIVRSYYRSHIPAESIVFDLGYSGSIARCLDECIGRRLQHAFVHESYTSTDMNRQAFGTNIDVMYGFVPENRDLIRELFFSDPKNQCVGFARCGDKITPNLASREIAYSEHFVIEKFFNAAIDFAKDFANTFDDIIAPSEIKPVICSHPFEALLLDASDADMDVLSPCFSEDFVFANKNRISISCFWRSLPRSYKEESSANLWVELEAWRRAAKLYKHPWRVLKYKFMSRFAFKHNKRVHYREMLKFPE